MTAGPAPCNTACARYQPPGATAHPGFVLTATILASSIAFVDASVVNVALPAIGRNLAVAGANLQ